MQKRLYTPQLSEANVRGLYQTARKFDFTMAKLLNLIVAIVWRSLLMLTRTKGRSVSPSDLKTLHQQAREAGFTDHGIKTMLSFLNIEPWSMSHKLYETVLEFVNPYNAPKFNNYWRW